MVVHVFIVESANIEVREQIFEKQTSDTPLNDSGTTEGSETNDDNKPSVLVDLGPPRYVERLKLDNLEELFEKLGEMFDQEVNATLVDDQYQNKHPLTEEGKAELERISDLRGYTNQISFCNCKWFEFLPEFNGIETDNHYVFLSANPFLNCYDFANELQVNLYSNCYFAWGIKDLMEGLNAKCYYNPFSTDKKHKQVNSLNEPVTIDIDAIKWLVEHGVRHVQWHIAAGILKHERFLQVNVPNWTTNIHSYFSDGIIRQYGLIPLPPPGEDSAILKGKKPQEQFNEDAQYRYNVLDYMLYALCKYGIEFGKINTINGNKETVNYNFILG